MTATTRAQSTYTGPSLCPYVVMVLLLTEHHAFMYNIEYAHAVIIIIIMAGKSGKDTI